MMYRQWQYLILVMIFSLPVAAAEVIYPAADNFYSGGVQASGDSLRNFTAPGARVIFSLNVPAAGVYPVTLIYTNTSSAPKSFRLLVNGLAVDDRKNSWVQLAAAESAKEPSKYTRALSLRAGVNTLCLENPIQTDEAIVIHALQVARGLALNARGATQPYDTYEAEAGATNGEVAVADRTYLTLQAESSGRQFVALRATGQYVQWVAQRPANALTLRYNIPDSAQGDGISSTLSLYINNKKVRSLTLSSHYAWVYGNYPYTNDVSKGEPHHFYDDSHFSGLNIPAGAVVKLQKDGADTAAYYNLDVIELEQIAPAYQQPKNFISITSQGAKANDGKDDTQAILATITQAQAHHKGVWIPPGVFTLTTKLKVADIHIRGAGIWHSSLQGIQGQGGFVGAGDKVTIADLALSSDSAQRKDAEDAAAFEGNFGTGSLIQNIWVEHMKVGVWLAAGTDGLLITGGRMRNLWADGVNIAGGVNNSQVSQLNIRNTGDDSMAMWSMGAANSNNSFRFNTAQLPALANTFAIYGGSDNKILDNIAADTVYASAGIAISSRFKPVPFSGTTEVRRNTLIRTGGYEPTYKYNLAALWIFADEQPITAHVLVEHLDILQATNAGILLSKGQSLAQLTLKDVTIQGAGGVGLLVDGVTGQGDFSGLVIDNAVEGGLRNTGFTIARGQGNRGW